MCRTSYINRKYLKKKNRLNERRCTNKLHQRCFNEKMTTAKCRKIINKDENLLKRNDNLHKYLQNKNINSRRRRARAHLNSNFLYIFENMSEYHR